MEPGSAWLHAYHSLPSIHPALLFAHRRASSHSSPYCRRKLLRILCIWPHKTAPLPPILDVAIPRLPLLAEHSMHDTSVMYATMQAHEQQVDIWILGNPTDAMFFSPLLAAATLLSGEISISFCLPHPVYDALSRERIVSGLWFR